MLKNIIFYLGRLSELIHRQNDEIIYSEQLSYAAEKNNKEILELLENY